MSAPPEPRTPNAPGWWLIIDGTEHGVAVFVHEPTGDGLQFDYGGNACETDLAKYTWAGRLEVRRSGARVGAVVDDPRLIMTFDPDSIRTAYALAVRDPEQDRFDYRRSCGGGTSGEPVPWQTITGATALLAEVLESEGAEPGELRVVVETQPATSKHSRDVEELRRVRYHIQAACELLGIPCRFVSIGSWASCFVPGAARLGEGAQKAAYKAHAQALTNGETTNEDRCAAFGMLACEVAQEECDLYIDGA